MAMHLRGVHAMVVAIVDVISIWNNKFYEIGLYK